VLDTRTWRSFDQGRKRPASMISAAGFKRQIPLSGEPGYVAPPGTDGLTLILAPGPVLDSDFYEWAKHTGSYVGLRFTADVENWRHALLAYERLFSRAFRRRARLVLMSGDVHYGFTARLAYWGRRPYEAPGPAPQVVRGVAAQVTSSGMRNGWGPGFSRRGYMRWNSLPAPAHFGGWHTPPLVYTKQNEFERPYSKPPVADVEKLVAVSAAPDWRYRVDYILADRDASKSYVITAPASWDEARSQATFRDALSRYLEFLREYGAGKEVVGENNVGEMTLVWRADQQVLTHRLWWRMTEPLKPFPHSVFRVSLTPEPEPAAIPVV
jgi:hypothetical protein